MITRKILMFAVAMVASIANSVEPDRTLITSYPIKCYQGELIEQQCKDGYWLTYNRQHYRVLVDAQKVIAWYPDHPAWAPKTYTNCSIAKVDHWVCRYSDGSGTFGVSNGEFYEEQTEEERRAWGLIYVDQQRWLEVKGQGNVVIKDYCAQRPLSQKSTCLVLRRSRRTDSATSP